MIPVLGLQGKTVAVFGLARTGLTAAHALAAGPDVRARGDDGDAAMPEAEEIARRLPYAARVIGEDRINFERQLAVEQDGGNA